MVLPAAMISAWLHPAQSFVLYQACSSFPQSTDHSLKSMKFGVKIIYMSKSIITALSSTLACGFVLMVNAARPAALRVDICPTEMEASLLPSLYSS